jgi:hypothetical protein
VTNKQVPYEDAKVHPVSQGPETDEAGEMAPTSKFVNNSSTYSLRLAFFCFFATGSIGSDINP